MEELVVTKRVTTTTSIVVEKVVAETKTQVYVKNHLPT